MFMYGKKVKQWIFFSDTIVVYDIKVGRCSQLNEYMTLMSTKGHSHSLTLVQINLSLVVDFLIGQRSAYQSFPDYFRQE